LIETTTVFDVTAVAADPPPPLLELEDPPPVSVTAVPLVCGIAGKTRDLGV
jgi:hypothetical protein